MIGVSEKRPGREQGLALLVLVAAIGFASSWLFLRHLHGASETIDVARRERNAEVLARAKEALIGYVAMKAADPDERNPGRLPCPEPAAWAGIEAAEGVAAPGVQGGISVPSCTSVGRLPWRTLGLGPLVDAHGEPLWYVVGPGWRLTTGASLLEIHSDRGGTLTVDGQQGQVVALIIAPGPALEVAAAPGCAARDQRHPSTGRRKAAPGIDPRNYLECFDEAALAFSTRSPATSFNDQVVAVTAAELMPAIEAAIAKRIESQIVPRLKEVYTPAGWGFAGTAPLYPFAAPFENPGPGPGTSSYRGVAGTYAGLLPFNQTQNCTPSPDNPRCVPDFLVFSKATPDVQVGGSGSIRTQSSCTWQGDTFICEGEYGEPSIALEVRVRIANVAMGLRRFAPAGIAVVAQDDYWGPGGNPPTASGAQAVPHQAVVTLQPDGSALLSVKTDLLPDIGTAGWGTYARYLVRIPRATIGDHALLDASDDTTGWFVRNRWFRLLYYAVAPGHTATALPSPPACTTGVDCLSVANLEPQTAQHAFLILAGRNLGSLPRPSGSLAAYLEAGNAGGAYERRPTSRAFPPFNDRFVVIAQNPSP